MTDIESPFFLRTIPCPACGVKGNQPDFRTGMYPA